MISVNPQKTHYAYLLRDLLIKPDICPDKDKLPGNQKEWNNFLALALRHKLTGYLYHFISCRSCNRKVPKAIEDKIMGLYTDFIIRQENYQRIKTKLKKFSKEYSVPLMIIKDIASQRLLKFDVDLFGRYKDLAKFSQFIAKLGYDSKGHHYGWPDDPRPEYKFCPSENNLSFPQIEYSYQALSYSETKKNILEKKDIEKLTAELWQNAQITPGSFTELQSEYLLIHHIIICYFEDGCKGLNNLYRIWLLYNQKKDKLDWEKVRKIAKRYKVANIVNFVLALAEREFSSMDTYVNNHLLSQQTDLNLYRLYQRLALRLIDLDYISRVYFPSDKKDFWCLKDYSVHFLTRGLLSEESIYYKIPFFLHPKRLFLLVWELIN